MRAGWTRNLAPLWLTCVLALAPAAAMAQAPASPQPDRVGYDNSIVKADFAGLDKAAILAMQRRLAVIYRNLPDWRDDAALQRQPLNDGIVGPVTLRWLQRYAYNFKLAGGPQAGRAMAAHMEKLEKFAVAHPDQLAVLLERAFDAWDAANPAATRERDYAVRRQGEEAALIALVARYRMRDQGGAQDDGYYNYVLNPEDLDRLGGKGDIGLLLAKLKDRPFPDKEALRVAVSAALKGRADPNGQMWKVVEQQVRPFYGYSLGADSRAAMQAGGMSADTLKQVAAFGAVYLKTRDDYDNYITARIASGEFAPSDAELVLLAEKSMVFDNYHLDQPALDTIARQMDGNLAYTGLPKPVLEMLAQIKEVDYPDRAIFNSAARSKIAFGLGMCKLNAPVNNSYARSLAISEEALAALHQQFEAFAPQGEAQLAQIKRLRGLTTRCDDDEQRQAGEIVAALYRPMQAAVESAARKKMPDVVTPVRIEGGDCGCALDDLAGVVYGFYPWWWKPDVVHSVNFRALNRMAFYGLTVDQSGELRLGAATFDIRDGSAAANGFVHTAHRYNAKVDWLIQKGDWDTDWRSLGEDSKKAVFRRLLDNISTLLNTPLSDPAARMKRLTTFVGDGPRRGDGVTLYFPNYPTDKNATDRFNEFYLQLRKEMDKHHLWLNLLVTQDTLAKGRNGGAGAFGLSNLIALREARSAAGQGGGGGWWSGRGQDEHAQENHEYLMVLLNEPSADAKKALRLLLENDSYLHGAQRADFLHSIMPVIQFDDGNWQQLDDDLVYARSNFGGVGLWAPDLDNMAAPVKEDSASCLASRQIVFCLLQAFGDDTVADTRAGPIEKFACVHRELLQWIMLVLLLTAMVLIVLFFKFCRVQNFIKKYFLWVQLAIAVPALLVFILLLLFDPALLKIRKGNLPFFISAAVIMLGMVAGYRFWRAQRQVPRRERGMPQREGIGFPIVVWSIDTEHGGFQWRIRNRGTGYAIIRKVEILLDGNPVADARTALESVMASGRHAQWKSVPLVGQKLEPGQQLVGLSIPHGEAALAFEQKLKAHDLAVKITYSGPNNEHWRSDGSGIVSVPGVAQ